MKGLRFAAAAAFGAMIAAEGCWLRPRPPGRLFIAGRPECRTVAWRVQGRSSSIRPRSSSTPARSSTASGSATRRAASCADAALINPAGRSRGPRLRNAAVLRPCHANVAGRRRSGPARGVLFPAPGKVSEPRKAVKNILAALDARRSRARLGGGEQRIASQHAKGKLTARERIDSCSTTTRSRSSTCSSSIAATTSAWRRRRFPATAW